MSDLEAVGTAEPVLRIVRGDPSAEELAALTVVLLATRRPTPSGQPTGRTGATAGGWSAYWRSVRAPLLPGPGAWRTSARG